jgi:hypothetical protein
MKRYVFELIVEEGNNEYWEGLTSRNETDCDGMTEQLRDMLAEHGFEPTVRLVKYEDK